MSREVVDPQIWRACAGASVRIPSLYSRVYYFPQGHVEHSCPSSSLISSSSSAPVPCVVSSVELLADPITDEVFAHLSLQPMSPDHSRFGSSDEEDDNKTVVTFAKTLTPSDANNGGGFSVPRRCADSVFPPLDLNADPPVQKLFFADIHGVVWDFRHTYRCTPRRHLLTTGWSKFVNEKKLIAGDSVVFMRKSVDEMFVGVRRAPIGGGEDDENYYGGGGGKKEFGRSGKGKLTVEAVSEAISKAVQGYPFEVVYYPTAGWSDFVVKAEDVEVSMAGYWTPGTRVKMAIETVDSSQVTWFQGTVSTTFQETCLWKQLQITWDEPEILQNLKRVNPWQVEIVANSSQLLPTYPPAKRFKYPHSTSGQAKMLYSGRGQQAVDPSPPYLFSFPAGMQGDWQYDQSGSFNFIGENTNNFFSPLSPNSSNTTNLSSGNELVGNRSHAVRVNSIQLFGQIINVQEVSESSLAEFGLYEEDGSKESSNNDVVNETQLCFTYASQGM